MSEDKKQIETKYQIQKKRKLCPHNDIDFYGLIRFERNYCRSTENDAYNGSSEFKEESNCVVKCLICGMTLKGSKATRFIDSLELRKELLP